MGVIAAAFSESFIRMFESLFPERVQRLITIGVVCVLFVICLALLALIVWSDWAYA